MTTYPTPNHHKLLRLKDKLRIVEKGQHVLEMKRGAPMFDFLDLLHRYEELSERVARLFESGERTRTLVLGRDGGIALQTTSWTRPSAPELLFGEAQIRGVEVPMILHRGIETVLDHRGYGVLGSSAAIDEVAAAHERLLEQIVSLAEMEEALKRLLREIWQTKLRVNAIRFRIVPELDAEIRYVEAQLGERDQEERLRQFFFKRHAEEAHPRRTMSDPDARQGRPVFPSTPPDVSMGVTSHPPGTARHESTS